VKTLCRCGVISKLEVLGFVGGFCEVDEGSIECLEHAAWRQVYIMNREDATESE
jgi:hypothetical protein